VAIEDAELLDGVETTMRGSFLAEGTRSHRIAQARVERAGSRRPVHLVHAHLRHALEDPLRQLTVPLLVLRGADDRLSTPDWARQLTAGVPHARYVELPRAHTVPWRDPHAWSEPVRSFAAASHG